MDHYYYAAPAVPGGDTPTRDGEPLLRREIEPPVRTWVRDRYGATTMRQLEGWGQPGVMPFGKWEAMWDARGPYTECGRWGGQLEPKPEPLDELLQWATERRDGEWFESAHEAYSDMIEQIEVLQGKRCRGCLRETGTGHKMDCAAQR